MTIETTVDTVPTTIAFSALPAIGAELGGGTFAGISTRKDGSHVAVILLPNKAQERLTWKGAAAWAAEVGGELPTRPIAALLYANAKSAFERTWHWTADSLEADTGDTEDASYAWVCSFDFGNQSSDRKSNDYAARAVRLIPLKA